MLTENIHHTNIHNAIITPRPQSFAELMEMYEINYIRLRLLCGDLKNVEGSYLSVLSHGAPLKLEIREQARHTSVIMLTYVFADKQRRPDLEVRVSHDARQAEVINRRFHLKHNTLEQSQSNNSVLLYRWQLNRFLYKWTRYLSYQGHSFTHHTHHDGSDISGS